MVATTLSVFIALLASPASAVVVYGTITSTTWTSDSSPYRVTGDVTVPAGHTLTIEPGVDVLFDADARFIVHGKLDAVGTASDSIGFAAGKSPQWMGIKIHGADTSRFEYARISDGYEDAMYPYYGGSALYVGEGGRAVLSHCVLIRNRYHDIYLYDDAWARLENCLVAYDAHDPDGTAGARLYVDATLELIRSTFAGNIFVLKRSRIVAHSCVIWGVQDDGITLHQDGSSPWPVWADVDYSIVKGPTVYAGLENRQPIC